MKHATPQALQRLTQMLNEIRSLGGLTEKRPGIFYRKSRAFLHFHEDADDLYADVRFDGTEFERLPCSTREDQKRLVTRIRRCLASARV